MRGTDVVLADWFLDAAIVCWFLISIAGIVLSLWQVRDARRRMLGLHAANEHPAVLQIAERDYWEACIAGAIFTLFVLYGVGAVAGLIVRQHQGSLLASTLLVIANILGLVAAAALLLLKRYRRLRSDLIVDALLKRYPLDKEDRT